jgi:hypothetical protein
MKNQFILGLILIFSGLNFLSCKKGDTTSSGNLLPIKTEKGISVGSSSSKLIGNTGGELISEDGKVKITVAPGTVSEPTEFSIQPITNTLHEEVSGKLAYRLLPEGISFSKPVSVVFTYGEHDLVNTVEDVLRAGFQQSNGSWKLVPTSLNKTNKTLSIETTHFSDWTVSGDLFLKAEKTVLTTGETTILSVIGVMAEDDLLAPLLPEMEGSISSIKNWGIISGPGSLNDVNGNGNINPSQKYSAPLDITNTQDVTVKVEIDGNITVPDPQAPSGNRVFKKIILLEKLTIVNEYMKVTLAGNVYSFSGSELVITGTENGLSIAGRNNELDLSILVSGNTAGTYACNNENGVQAFLVNGSRFFSTFYMKCLGQGAVYSGAPIVIEKAGGIGDWTKGRFTENLFDNQADACAGPVPTVTAAIEFSGIRRN